VRIRSPGRHRRRLGRHFTRLWVGYTAASTSDGLAYGAVPLLALSVNPHPAAVSSVVAADALPWLLMALPAGHLADRFNRGSVAAASNALRAVVVLMAVLLIASNSMSLGLLLLLVLANSSGRAVYYSAAQAMVPDLVDSSALESANGALMGSEFGAEQLAGPAIGSWLFTVGAAIPFIADAITLVLSCIPFSRFKKRTEQPTEAPGRVSEGVRLLFADRRLTLLVLMVATLAGLQGMEAGVLVLLATTEWGVRQGAYGLFLGIGAAGSLFGSFAASSVVARFGSARTLIAAALFSGVAYLMMASAKTWLLAAPAFILVGLAVGAGSVVATSLRHRFTPADIQGRVGSAWRGIIWGVAPVGALAAGALATFGNIRLPLVIAGVLQCVVGVVLARPLLRTMTEDRHRTTPAAHGRHVRLSGTGSKDIRLAARDIVVPTEAPTLDPRQM